MRYLDKAIKIQRQRDFLYVALFFILMKAENPFEQIKYLFLRTNVHKSVDNERVFVYIKYTEHTFLFIKNWRREEMKKKRTYRIKSKLRFSIFITIVFILGITVSNTILNLDIVQGQTKQEYVKVKVIQGETLWDIAKSYSDENTDIRDKISKIKEINKLDNSGITPGQIISIPIS